MRGQSNWNIGIERNLSRQRSRIQPAYDSRRLRDPEDRVSIVIAAAFEGLRPVNADEPIRRAARFHYSLHYRRSSTQPATSMNLLRLLEVGSVHKLAKADTATPSVPT